MAEDAKTVESAESRNAKASLEPVTTYWKAMHNCFIKGVNYRFGQVIAVEPGSEPPSRKHFNQISYMEYELIKKDASEAVSYVTTAEEEVEARERQARLIQSRNALI